MKKDDNFILISQTFFQLKLLIDNSNRVG